MSFGEICGVLWLGYVSGLVVDIVCLYVKCAREAKERKPE